jgi:hypothetical protein
MFFTLTVSQESSDAPRGHAELTEAETWALAQFIKRVGWTEFRGNAADEAEACEIRSAIDKLQQALAGAGVAPR